MTPAFSVKFVINRILGTFKIELTDDSDYTGVSTAYGFYKITYPDGIFYENTDALNPDFTLADSSSEINLRTKNSNLITGQYKIQQKIYTNTGFFSLEKNIAFSFVEPVLSMGFAGNLLTPTVILEDKTTYAVTNYTQVVTRVTSCNFPDHLPISGTQLTSVNPLLTMVDSGNYYEGIYQPTLNVSVAYTGTNHTIELVKESQFEISVKRLLSYSELTTLFNQQKEKLDESTGRQTNRQILEDYQTIGSLYDHIELKIKSGEEGIDVLMIELQNLVYKTTCCNIEDYEYSTSPLTEFDYSEVVESGFNIVANGENVNQFTSASNKKILFEGSGGTSVSFDPSENKVIISSEGNLSALFVSSEDYDQVNFDRLGGYIYGSPESPITDAQISLNFSGAKEFSNAIIYHQSDSIPTFDGFDTPNNQKIVGSYVTSELNRIVIVHEGNENITIGFVNDSGGTAIQDGIEVVGTITITSPTTADLSGFVYRIAGVQFTSGTLEDIAITGTPSLYPRTDFFVGKFNPSFPSGGVGIIEYLPGTESEDEVILPVIPPNAVLLGSVNRNIDGSNDFEPINPDLSDFVSRSATGNQTIQSDLTIAKRAGDLPNFATFGTNGLLARSNPAIAGVFSTLAGIGGFSKILTITIDPAVQINYYAVLEFYGISTNYEKGFLWVQFEVNGSGNLIKNKLQCFGEFDVSKYTLVKTSSTTYTLFVFHDESDSFYKFRPLSQFGSSFRYVYHQLQPKVNPLPLGDQFSFSLFGGGGSTGAGAGLSIDGDSDIQLGNDGAGVIDFSDQSVFSSGINLFYNDDEKSLSAIFSDAEFQVNTNWDSSINSDSSSANLEIQSNENSQARIDLLKSVNGLEQSLSFDPVTNLILISDGINSKGFENAGDYEANFTARSLVTKQYVDGLGTGSGTVTSVALSAPSIFSVSGSPITDSGTLALGLSDQSAFTVFARESGTGVPSFQSLAVGHLPNDIPFTKIEHIASNTILGRGTGAGVTQELTGSEARDIIGANPLITGTKTEGYVATIVGGEETWAPSGGGGGTRVAFSSEIDPTGNFFSKHSQTGAIAYTLGAGLIVNDHFENTTRHYIEANGTGGKPTFSSAFVLQMDTWSNNTGDINCLIFKVGISGKIYVWMDNVEIT